MVSYRKKGALARRNRKSSFKLFGKTYNKKETVVGVSFLLPALILGIIFTITPMLISLSYAFTDANFFALDSAKWNNFANFGRLFRDETLWKALGNTFLFVVVATPLQLVIALGLALLLNKKTLRCGTFFRWAFFTPVMLSLAVTSMLWLNLLDTQSGLIPKLLEQWGLVDESKKLFLDNPKQAMMVIVFISVWQGAGYQMLIFLSGLKNIPPELYEAASIDGATPTRQFFSITLPSIMPTFSFTLVTTLIGAFRLITQPMVMTPGGGVDYSTMTMSYWIYKQGIEYADVGYSSAIAIFYTIIMSVIALSLRKLTGGDNTTTEKPKRRKRKGNNGGTDLTEKETVQPKEQVVVSPAAEAVQNGSV